MSLTTNERLQEALSLALEDRSAGYADLVSNANAILSVIKRKDCMKTFSGPTIRERLLYNESGTYVRYSGFQHLNPRPAELFNDAEYEPKLAAVSVTLANEDILKNSGRNQLMNLMQAHIKAAEQELVDRFVEDLHGDGTLDGGKQIGGLQLAIPTNPALGVYGGISRVDNEIWRTKAFDIQTSPLFANLDGTTDTQVTSDNIYEIFSICVEQLTRGKKGPDIAVCSMEHYRKFAVSMRDIQRVTKAGGLAESGFTALQHNFSGRELEVVLEGGIGSAMPANTTYFLDCENLKFRYHPDRNFVRFGGKQMPVNQDAVVQHIGFFGNLTLSNPLHQGKLFDSAPSS